ncbi:MAG TPA: phenylacetic acid degradation operon negative regulatory protein PaaX [Virgibacillus sp.]|nr:phenylacetic acid degradation operon negative regulatory protein PaaX [Virgibacillus sp.]HLR67800.1 phenylacetic acid degradation operon negative regulatory protein PaaX [Virgibacillus sp.]
MNKTPNTRSMIFTIYGDYIRHYGDGIWIGSLIKLLQAFGHNDQSVRAAISRMNKQGWVQSNRVGNKSYYSLTSQGKDRMEEASKRIYKEEPKPWSGNWWILFYSIPEEKRHLRDKLREELIWSGFGPLSNSCWITPNDLAKETKLLIEKYGIKDYITIFKAEHLGMNSNSDLVEKCWDLEDINNRYETFIKHYSQKYIIDKSKIETNKMTDDECFVEKTLLVHEFRKFLFVDPGLPDELLPEKWLGDSATKLFQDYNKILSEPSKRFFESIYEFEK